MYIIVTYGKRPVKVQSVKLKDIREAMEKKRKQEKGKNMYLSIKQENPQTKCNTVSVLTMCLVPQEFEA